MPFVGNTLAKNNAMLLDANAPPLFSLSLSALHSLSSLYSLSQVETMSAMYQCQDLRCPDTRQVQLGVMTDYCPESSKRYQCDVSPRAIRQQLKTFLNIARYHSFTWLEEVVATMLQIEFGVSTTQVLEEEGEEMSVEEEEEREYYQQQPSSQPSQPQQHKRARQTSSSRQQPRQQEESEEEVEEEDWQQDEMEMASDSDEEEEAAFQKRKRSRRRRNEDINMELA